MKTNNKSKLKKYFYSTIGITANASEVIRESVHELVKKGRMNEADGKRIIHDAVSRVGVVKPLMEAKYNQAIHNAMAYASSKVAELQKSVQMLEKHLMMGTMPAQGHAHRKLQVKRVRA